MSPMRSPRQLFRAAYSDSCSMNWISAGLPQLRWRENGVTVAAELIAYIKS
jgi:hypothetical protein